MKAWSKLATCSIYVYKRQVLETTEEENLRMIRESCRYLKAHGKEVIFDAEHYFDGYKDDADFALRMAEAAVAGGAGMILSLIHI